MNINKELLIKLREKTKLSFLDCVKVLRKTNNNLNLSEKILQKKNILIKKKTNISFMNFYKYKKIFVFIKLKSESIFLKNYIELKNLIKKIILILIVKKPKNIYILLKKKINKNYLIKNIKNLLKKTKENFKIKKFNIIKNIFENIIYNYENKIIILINYYKKKNYLTKNICLHILFYKPIYISLKSIFLKLILNKYRIIKIKKNILKEKNINKLFKKYTLLNQKFIKNNNFKIKNIIKEKKIKINNFLIYK